MKKLFSTIFAVILFAVAASAQGVLKFDKELHDFGKVKEAGVITTEFTVTNTGNVPVVISAANASCGCTTPEYSKDPILPGAKSKIKVGFNTDGRPGNFDKTVTVVSNAENGTQVIRIKGAVTGKTEPKAN
ncbi:MAG: DUF1573 domain-containing protein [Leadbetterella sp.]